MDYGLENRDEVFRLAGAAVVSAVDDREAVQWLRAHFPFSSGHIDWETMPGALLLPVVDHMAPAAVSAGFERSLAHVGAVDQQAVWVIWSDICESLRMPVAACRLALEPLLFVSPGTHFASLEGGWCIEFDFFNQWHAGRSRGGPVINRSGD